MNQGTGVLSETVSSLPGQFMKFRLLIPVSLVFSLVVSASNDRVDVGEFSKGSLSGWETEKFVGETIYKLIEDNGQQVLHANSISSASGMGRKIKVDLTKTPYVNWSWKIERRLPPLEEGTKGGDDYAARLYIVRSGGMLGWSTRAVNYVWSGSKERNTSWPNPYSPKNSIMVATRSDADKTGVWVTEKRNVLEDFKKLFGKNIESIDAVAIMTDTDNSGLRARAVYGDIYFTAE